MPPDSVSDPDTRIAECEAALDVIRSQFSTSSEPVRVLMDHLCDLQAHQPPQEESPKEPETVAARPAMSLDEGLMQSPVLLVGLGLAVLAALMGLSTLFIGMLAAKWLAL